MARKLEAWATNIDSGVGGRSTYDWDLWLNGKVWKLKQGEDFACKLLSIQSQVRHAAEKRNLRVTTAILPDENAIIFQVISDPKPAPKARKRVAKK